MALAFVQSNAAYGGSGLGDPSNLASVGVALTGVGAGNLIVFWCKHEGATTTYTVSDGTTTLTNGTIVNHGNGDLHGVWAYLLVANSGSKTYTVTFGASRPYVRLHVWEFSYTGTASLDTQNTGSGSSSAPASGAITTAATDEVVLGGYGEYSAGTPSSPLVNSVAATGSQLDAPTGALTSSWYRLLAATFAGGTASLTLSGSGDWICNVIALQTDAGGGATTWGALLDRSRNRLVGVL
jgi:hypothetical protein